jgi:hypothetical protein
MFLTHSRSFCNSWFLIKLTLTLFFKNTKIQKKSENQNRMQNKKIKGPKQN